jgi:hypothetical protein
MKLLPHQICIMALRRPAEKHHMITLPTMEEALMRLRKHTGQDFGEDSEKLRVWFE